MIRTVDLKEEKLEHTNNVTFMLGGKQLIIYGKGDASPMAVKDRLLQKVKEWDIPKVKDVVLSFIELDCKLKGYKSTFDSYSIETEETSIEAMERILMGQTPPDYRTCQPKNRTTWDYTFFCMEDDRSFVQVTHVTADQSVWHVDCRLNELSDESFIKFQSMEKKTKADEANAPRQVLVWDEEKYPLV